MTVSRGIIAVALVLVFGTTGCGEPPPADEAEPIIGVKIYEAERDLQELD